MGSSAGDWLVIFSSICALGAAIFAFLAFLRAGAAAASSQNSIAEMLRSEADRSRQVSEDQARGLRQELSENLRGFQETTLKVFRELSDSLGAQVREFGNRLDVGVKAIDDRATAIGTKLDTEIQGMGQEANKNRDALRQVIESKLDDAATKQSSAAREAREEIVGSFKILGSAVDGTLERVSQQQKERLENVTAALSTLTEKHDKSQEALRQTIEGRLDSIRTENAAKLDEMRRTVDERLQTTLEARLSQNFQVVSEHLQRVAIGLGEMQQMALGVSDLKRVLTQVKTRGIWGEAQLGSLLEDVLAPDQFSRNVAVNPNSQERVEFAIRLPRLTDSHSEVLLPIDAKFPLEYFERVVAAAESADPTALEDASRALERAVRLQAKDIASKYILPPHTTEYAVMFLPSESLYAEVARLPGLVEAMTRECGVMLAGPATLMALLNAVRVGFRSALIHRQAGEISKLLQKVRAEFSKYGVAVQTVYRRASSTVEAIEKLQTRQNVMGKALKGIDLLSSDTSIDAATMLLELQTDDFDSDAEDKA